MRLTADVETPGVRAESTCAKLRIPALKQ